MPVFEICQLLFLSTQTTKIWSDLQKRGGETIKILTQGVIKSGGGGTVLVTSLIQTTRGEYTCIQES